MKNIYSNIYKPNSINLSKAKKIIENNSVIGLPTETFADLDAIVNLADRARAAGRQIRGNTNVTVSVSTFVPKPHTSFQWDRQITLKETIEKQSYLRAQLKQKKINFRRLC